MNDSLYYIPYLIELCIKIYLEGCQSDLLFETMLLLLEFLANKSSIELTECCEYGCTAT